MRSHIRLALTLGLSGLAVLLVAWPRVRLVQAEQPPGVTVLAEDFKPVTTKRVLMEWQEKAFSGMNRAIPRAKEDVVAEHAWLLAELANVNIHHSDKDDYRGWATEMRDTAVKLAKAAKDKDFDLVKKHAKAVHATCQACHDVYRK